MPHLQLVAVTVLVPSANKTASDLMAWITTVVDMTGLAGFVYLEDPEPKFLAINENSICIVSLQENNGIALIDVAMPWQALQQIW